MTKLKTKTLKVKVASGQIDGERVITAVVTSNNTDRDYEQVDVASLRLPLKGGGFVYASKLTGTEPIDIPMLVNHSFDVEDTIGSVRRAVMNDAGELVVDFGVSSRAKAQDLMTLVDERHLDNAFSITMNDFDYKDSTIYDAEIVEISLVFRGSNKDARVLAVKSLKGAKDMTLEEKKAEIERLQKEVAAEDTEAQAKAEAEAKEKAEAEAQAEREAAEQKAKDKAAKETESKKKEGEMKDKKILAKEVKDKKTPEQPVKATAAEFDAREHAAKQYQAWVKKDFAALADLNKKALDTFKDVKSKETYMNTGVTADGGAIVPSAQLLREVFTTLGEFSTVANDLRPITLTEGDSIDVATLVADVVMNEVSTEGGTKTVTKPTMGDGNVALREFAGIAIITKKLVRQSAISVYDLLRESFARAVANRRALLALTDAASGITNKAGVVSVVGGLDWSTVKQMPYSIPTSAVPGSKYYISRELLSELDQSVDSTGRDLDILTLDGNGLSGRFKNGFQFAVEEELGQGGASHAVFGAMGRFGILLKQGVLESETFDTGTVVDGSNVTHNLLQQNKIAQRVAFYENVGFPIAGAFAKLDESES